VVNPLLRNSEKAYKMAEVSLNSESRRFSTEMLYKGARRVHGGRRKITSNVAGRGRGRPGGLGEKNEKGSKSTSKSEGKKGGKNEEDQWQSEIKKSDHRVPSIFKPCRQSATQTA